MLQNILPMEMNIDFKIREPQKQDYVIMIEDSNVLVSEKTCQQVEFLTIGEMQLEKNEVMFLFTVDDVHYYLYTGLTSYINDGKYKSVELRELLHEYDNVFAYISLTAHHIYEWYKTNQYCGKCGSGMIVDAKERKLNCTLCDHLDYPKINPVVIVGITNNDKLLLTKYANSNYDRYSLVAGFVEIGESLEDTVKREVLEEVGLKVKNIKYFGSQPWGISGGLLTGYFAEVDGDDKIVLDLDELKEGIWVTKEEIPFVNDHEKTLTRSMMYDWLKNQ